MSLICFEALGGIYCSTLRYLYRKAILILFGSSSQKMSILLVLVTLICLVRTRTLLTQEYYSNSNNSNQIDAKAQQQKHKKLQYAKPNLVFHVGPPKTATTTIQETMLSYAQPNFLFDSDNYIYLGIIPDEGEPNDHRNDYTNPMKRLRRIIPYERTELLLALRDPMCHLAMSRIREDYYANIRATTMAPQNNNPSLRDLLLQLSCAQRIVQSMEQYSVKRTNIVFSEELMSRDFRIPTTTVSNDSTSNSNITIQSILDWVCLALLVQPYYKVTIIVSYRRYYEWLPSAKQQQERWARRKRQWDSWPSNESAKVSSTMFSNANNDTPTNNNNMTLNDSRNNGLVMEPLFPNYWKNIIPGRVVLYGNHFNKNISAIGVTVVNDTSIYLSRQRQQEERQQELRQEKLQDQDPSKIGSSKEKRISSIAQMNEEITFWANTIGISFHYADTVLNSLRPLLSIYDTFSNNGNHGALFDVKIFNLHSLSSINNYTEPLVISTFFCDALPNATNSCLYSQENDRNEVLAKKGGTTSGRWNPSRSYTVYDQLVTAAYLSGKLSYRYVRHGRHQTVVAAQQYHQSLLSIKDDATVIGDGTNTTDLNQDDDADTSRNIRNTKASEHGIIMNHLLMVPSHLSSAASATNAGTTVLLQEDLLRLQRENQLNNYSFVVSCPDRTELELYLQKSLQYEVLVFGGVDVSEQQRHIDDFWYDAVVKKKFCSINTTATLQQKHWDNFFFSEQSYRYLD